MNDTTLIYRPNRVYIGFAAIFVMFTLFFMVLAFYLWDLNDSSHMLLFGIGTTLVAYYLYRESTVTYFVCEHGIEATVLGKLIYSYPWRLFSHTYVVRDYRGSRWFLLSPRTLTKKEQRTQIYIRTLYTKSYRDRVLAIYIEGDLIEEIQNRITKLT